MSAEEEASVAGGSGPKSKITGLVMARGGSKGIPGKNIKLMCGKPLIGWILDSARASGVFDEVYVSTECDKIAEVAKQHGALVHIRPSELARDTSSAYDAIKQFIDTHPEVEVCGLMQCTTPTTHPDHIRMAAEKIWSGYDSVFSVVRLHMFRWSEIKQKAAATMPQNLDPKNRPRRQDWDGELYENGAFYFFTRDLVCNDGVLQGGRCSYVEMAEELSCDIDLPSDWDIAEQRVQKYGFKTT